MDRESMDILSVSPQPSACFVKLTAHVTISEVSSTPGKGGQLGPRGGSLSAQVQLKGLGGSLGPRGPLLGPGPRPLLQSLRVHSNSVKVVFVHNLSRTGM